MAAIHLQLTDELQETASLYAAGALPEDERLEYARHLDEDNCTVCRREALEFQSAANLLVLQQPLETPSPQVRERLLAQARAAAPRVREHTRRDMPAGGARRGWFGWAAGLAAVAATAALAFVLNDNAQLRRMAGALSDRIAQLESEGLTDQRVRLASLTSPQVRVVNLAGQGANAAARGRIFWDQSRRRWLFFAENLPRTASDRTYQIWFVPSSGNPVSASVFNTDAAGSVAIEIPVPENITQVKAAAVTTEPAGGLNQPSGPFALLGSIE